MTIYLKEQISELSRLILNTQKIKGDNKSNPIHTTAGMNGQDNLDEQMLLLIEDLKILRTNLINEQSKMQRNLWQVNCYIADALRQNNVLMTTDTNGRSKKNA
jgi:hypothetical protein